MNISRGLEDKKPTSDLSEENPTPLQSMHNLALSDPKRGNKREAMLNNGKTLIDTLYSTHSLADFYFNLGRDQEAMQLQEQIVEARERVLGDEHPDTQL